MAAIIWLNASALAHREYLSRLRQRRNIHLLMCVYHDHDRSSWCSRGQDNVEGYAVWRDAQKPRCLQLQQQVASYSVCDSVGNSKHKINVLFLSPSLQCTVGFLESCAAHCRSVVKVENLR